MNTFLKPSDMLYDKCENSVNQLKHSLDICLELASLSWKLLGKPIKKDNKKGKSTLINLLGYKKAHNYAENLKKKILLKLKKHGKNSEQLGKVWNIEKNGKLRNGTIWKNGKWKTVWYHMVPYDTILYHMAPYGTLWYHMVPYGIIWYHMVS